MKKWMLQLFAVAMLAVALAGAAVAQPYPNKPIRVIVPFTPGGNVDVVARLVNQKLEADLGQALVIENLAGASGAIGAGNVAHSKPDGYTLLANSSIHVILPGLQRNLGYDALGDFIPLSQVTEVPLVLLVSTEHMPAKTHAEFVAWAKAQPQSIDYATFIGAATHLAAELWKEQTGVKVNMIPYKAGTSAQVDVVAGRVPFQFEALFAATALIRGGKLRPLAITSSKRVAAFPDVPTFAELGFPGIDANTWHGYWAPRGTPKEVVDKLGAALVKAGQNKEVRERIESMGGHVVASTPAEFAEFNRKEAQRWAALLKRSGIEPQ
jgi:tripartite-type tricarboxylate transporter receptor subunit TctC